MGKSKQRAAIKRHVAPRAFTDYEAMMKRAKELYEMRLEHAHGEFLRALAEIKMGSKAQVQKTVEEAADEGGRVSDFDEENQKTRHA